MVKALAGFKNSLGQNPYCNPHGQAGLLPRPLDGLHSLQFVWSVSRAVNQAVERITSAFLGIFQFVIYGL